MVKLSFSIDEMRTRFPTLCEPRPQDSHKGTFGTVGVIGGAVGMSGAPVLAAMSALKIGCGRVLIGFQQAKLSMPWIPNMPEIMVHTAEKLLARSDITAWVVGCGLGLSSVSRNVVESMRHRKQPIVFDADAIVLLSQHQFWLPEEMNIVLTPHPGEAAKLLHCDINEIQSDRIRAAVKIATEYGAWTVLKGYRTVIAAPNGEYSINETGNPILAVAGSGDVLSGVIGSFLAQGVPISEAVHAAVWLHGAAADNFVKRGIEIGLCASELIDEMRMIRNQLLRTGFE